ncbi:maebl, partial [Streptococcus sp. 9903]|uniref:maebl n=1 Tax=Streptococcus sp. 9903 TaxID=2582677 RepID=UPI001565BB20
MDKKRMILASLASAAVLGAGFTTVQPLVVKADENAAKPATPKVIQDAEADAKKAEEKVTEAQAKVDAKTTEATAAATKVEAEKKEDADAKAAKAEADKAKKDAETEKTAADAELTAAKEEAKQADAKAKEEEAKAEAKAKEDAATKKAISDSLDKLVADAEKAINDNKKITDKEKAIKELKEKIGKEDLLAAIEAGEISIDNVAAELNDDAAKAEANEAADKKMRDKDQAAKSTAADAGATSETGTAKKDMPADLKATIAEAEKADAARPESEKLQDKADQLDDQLNRVEAQFDEAKKVAEEKAAVLDKKETALKEAKEAADIAEKYNLKDEIVKPLKNVVTEIEKDRNEANSEFEQADSAAAYYAEQGKELEAEYNNTVAAVKAAKEEEAKNPKPAEKPVEKPKVKTEAEKAAEAKAEADKKVAAAEAKVAEADAKVNETTKALEEATTKATKEEADVQPAEDAKTAADKAKAEAEDELAKAKEAAVTAKAKVEELKKDEADSLAGLKYALEKMEADAIEKINKDDKITDKDAAIDKAKAAIGKEDLLKAIENGEISASEAARDLDDQAATAEANKNQDPQDNNIGATTPTIQDGAKVSEADKKAFAEADKKAAARPASEKIQDRVDQLLKEINYLTAIADKDKAAAEVLLEKFNHAKEVLLEAGQAERAAEEANSNPEVLEALKKVVYNLELDRDTAKQELAKILVPLEAYTEQINKLTDEYNQTLKDLEAAKAAEKVDALKVEIKDLEAELAKDKDNEEISDKLNAMRSALARAEKDLKENPNALVYAVLLPKVDALPTASQALKAEINKLREEKEKTTDDSQKAELEKKIAEKEALLAEVEKAEETPAQPAE